MAKLELNLDRVIVFEDRAQVRRLGKLELSAGQHQLTATGVAPTLADKTLTCRVLSGEAEVVDAHVKRQRVARDLRPEEMKRIADRIEELEIEQKRLQVTARQLEAARQKLQRLSELTLGELSEGAAAGLSVEDSWHDPLDQLEQRDDQLLAQLSQVEQQLSELELTLKDVQQQAEAAQTPSGEFSACITIELRVLQAGTLELELLYLTPNCAWRPQHEAELLPEETRVRISSSACVWQNTGEDWNGVELQFSSERASLGASPPLLQSDELLTQKTTRQVDVEQREETLFESGLGRSKTAAQLPGVDDGGEAIERAARGRLSIPGDGRPHLIPLATFESEASLSYLVAAELSCCVHLRVELENTTSNALLPGPVVLLRRSGRVGITQMPFIAPQERFELGFGPVPSLRVQREVETLDSEQKTLSSWTTTPYRVRVSLSNLGPEVWNIDVKERVLVSEVEKVKVQVDSQKTTNRAAPDANGFLLWHVELGAFGAEKVELGYQITRHDDVVGLA